MSNEIEEDQRGRDSYDPYLYVPTDSAETVTGFENVTDAEIDRFKAQGFLAIEDAFSLEQIDDAIAAVEDLVAGKNGTYKGVQFERGVRKKGCRLVFTQHGASFV